MNEVARALFQGPRISYSELASWLRCPRQHSYRYLERATPEHKSSALAFGSAIHRALAHFYSAMRDGEEEPCADELHDVFSGAWDEQLAEDVPVLFGDKEDAGGMKDTGVAMLDAFLEQGLRVDRVVEVEMPFSVELIDADSGDSLPRFVGVFDMVTQAPDGSYSVVEHKTGARRWTEDRLAFDAQISGYAAAAPLVGLGEAQVQVQLLLKTKKPAVEVYRPTRTDRDLEEFLEMACGVARSIDAGISFPRRDWWCRGCEFAGRCVAG